MPLAPLEEAVLTGPVEDQPGEGEVHIDESHEEAQPARFVSSPPSVSAEAMEQHRADHQPFRTWCKFCIMGRGLGQSHTASPEESSVAIVAQDYFYITSEGVQRRDELDLEIRDDNIKNRRRPTQWAHRQVCRSAMPG